MTTEIYSRKRMARIVACLAFILYGGMAVSFLWSYPKALAAAAGGTLVIGLVGGVLMAGSLFVCFYAGGRVFRPTIVEGALVRTDGQFVRREHNDLVICVQGRKYKFPLDSNIDNRLNSASTETVQVRMEVGAFGRPFCLEVR